MGQNKDVINRFYPESRIGDYTSVDGTVEFWGRVNTLVDESSQVLDFGAGRAAWFEDDPSHFRRFVRHIQPRVGKLVACDIDDAVLQNRAADEQRQIEIGSPLPFADQAFDLIVSDYTFEHIANPQEVAREFDRILKPGGWICARTPNKYGYISLATRLITNRHHAKVIKHAQPGRKEIDIFPTTFLMNTRRALDKLFPQPAYKNLTYYYDAEPAYYFGSGMVFWLMRLVNKMLPSFLKSNLFIFLQKQES